MIFAWYALVALAVIVHILLSCGMPTSFIKITGLAIGLFGFSLWLSARIQLGHCFTLTPKATGIVRYGMFAKLRHPIYVFSSLTWLGIAIYTGDWRLFGLLPILMAVQFWRARKEEAVLMYKFPHEYAEYKKYTYF